MYDNILWLITARSGSKSIVDKNIKMLGEFPLFYYRYLSAKKISPIDNIWGSTDSVDYIKIFNEYGLITPFVRPNELALDEFLEESDEDADTEAAFLKLRPNCKRNFREN